MAAHVRLKIEFTEVEEVEKYHNLMRWLISLLIEINRAL